MCIYKIIYTSFISLNQTLLKTVIEWIKSTINNCPNKRKSSILFQNKSSSKDFITTTLISPAQEFELKSFDKPVLDIERLTGRPVVAPRVTDIDEEGGQIKRWRDISSTAVGEPVHSKDTVLSCFMTLVATILLTGSMILIGTAAVPKVTDSSTQVVTSL